MKNREVYKYIALNSCDKVSLSNIGAKQSGYFEEKIYIDLKWTRAGIRKKIGLETVATCNRTTSEKNITKTLLKRVKHESSLSQSQA